jgi:hypothetical protein
LEKTSKLESGHNPQQNFFAALSIVMKMTAWFTRARSVKTMSSCVLACRLPFFLQGLVYVSVPIAGRVDLHASCVLLPRRLPTQTCPVLGGSLVLSFEFYVLFILLGPLISSFFSRFSFLKFFLLSFTYERSMPVQLTRRPGPYLFHLAFSCPPRNLVFSSLSSYTLYNSVRYLFVTPFYLHLRLSYFYL